MVRISRHNYGNVQFSHTAITTVTDNEIREMEISHAIVQRQQRCSTVIITTTRAWRHFNDEDRQWNF